MSAVCCRGPLLLQALRGVVAMCTGAGMGAAAVFERDSYEVEAPAPAS